MDLKETDGWKLTSDSVVYNDEILPNTLNKILTEQKVLWQGGWFMTQDHTVNLSEPVSEQKNGIVLVFSDYSSSKVNDWYWQTYFIPKKFVEEKPGAGHSILLVGGSNFDKIGSKYLYINDDRIVGHANNNKTGTASGLNYANNGFVLRYVIGV